MEISLGTNEYQQFVDLSSNVGVINYTLEDVIKELHELNYTMARIADMMAVMKR